MGGQYLAAANKKDKSNQNVINIFDSYSLEQIKSIPAHSQTITDIHWGALDQYFYTCGKDGIVNNWSLENNEWGRKDFPRSNCKYHSITAIEHVDSNSTSKASYNNMKVYYAGTEQLQNNQ